jgi:hypothetical protein
MCSVYILSKMTSKNIHMVGFQDHARLHTSCTSWECSDSTHTLIGQPALLDGATDYKRHRLQTLEAQTKQRKHLTKGGENLALS